MNAFAHVTKFSRGRKYRYTLWRKFSTSEDLFSHEKASRISSYAMFIGLNPSTADEKKDDPTVRRCIGFAKRWGFGALCMTNLFAWRATDPREMKGQPHPIGPENDRWLTACARDAGIVVAAWGVHGAFMGRDEEVLKLLDGLKCLGTTKDGYPKHPLYVSYDVSPVDYTKP